MRQEAQTNTPGSIGWRTRSSTPSSNASALSRRLRRPVRLNRNQKRCTLMLLVDVAREAIETAQDFGV